MADKKPKKFGLLKDELDFIIKHFGTNFNSIGKDFLVKLAKDKKKIDCNNLFFKIENKSAVKDVYFLKEFGTLYDLLIYLLNNKRITISSRNQLNFLEAINVLEIIISSMKSDVTDKSEEQKKKKNLQNKRVF